MCSLYVPWTMSQPVYKVSQGGGVGWGLGGLRSMEDSGWDLRVKLITKQEVTDEHFRKSNLMNMNTCYFPQVNPAASPTGNPLHHHLTTGLHVPQTQPPAAWTAPTTNTASVRRHQEEIYIAGSCYVEWLKVKIFDSRY